MKSNDCESLLRRARAQLQKLLGEKRKVSYELALVLHQIARKRLYAVDYPSFAAFVRAEAGGMTDKNAWLHVRMVDCGFVREQWLRIGMSKLARVMVLRSSEKRDGLLREAHDLTTHEIVARVDLIRGVCRKQSTRKPTSMLLVGEVAQSIMRLAAATGVTPQRYVELMVHGMAKRSGRAA